MTTTLTCTLNEKLLQHYVDGDLSQAESHLVQQHVGDCPSCRRQFITLQRAVLLVESLPRMAAPPMVFSSTMAAVMAAHRQRHSGSRWLPFFSLLAAALSVAASTLCLSVGGESLADALESALDDPAFFFDSILSASVDLEWSLLLGICLLLVASAGVLFQMVRNELATSNAA